MKKVLFIDRDGTIVSEPEDEQLDSFEKLRFLPNAISALKSIAAELNFDLVMVTNQDGLGTDSHPEANFWPVHNHILELLEGEGVKFSKIFIDRSFPKEKLDTRKPGTGMLTDYIEGDYDLENSFIIGDRLTDIELAKNLGAKGILIQEDARNLGTSEISSDEASLSPFIALKTSKWEEIVHFLRTKDRHVHVTRNTSETAIHITLNPDGLGNYSIDTGLGFFDHMLEQLARHGGMDLDIKVEGDLHIDEHHTIEDTALALGEAVKTSLGKKAGIARYAFQLPMDDCQVNVSLDLGGRSWLEWDATFKREKIGEMPTEMFYHFFKSFCDEAKCNLHVQATGDNEHHKIEAIFKAFARCMKLAVARSAGDASLPTTKGTL